jgi:hypothetical protein
LRRDQPTVLDVVKEAIKHRGVRMVVVGDVPSPWGEAAKGILHIKGIEWVAVRLAYHGELLKEWAGRLLQFSTRRTLNVDAVSRWSLLIALALAIPALGQAIAQAQADAPDAANLYRPQGSGEAAATPRQKNAACCRIITAQTVARW